MFSAIVDGFKAIISFFETLIDLIVKIVKAGANLIISLPDILNSLSAAIGILPTVLISAAIFCLTVRAAVIILNHKAGEN